MNRIYPPMPDSAPLLAMRAIYASNLELAAIEPLLEANQDRHSRLAAIELINKEYSDLIEGPAQRSAPIFLPAQLASTLPPGLSTELFVPVLSPLQAQDSDIQDVFQRLADAGYRLALEVSDAHPPPPVSWLQQAHIIKLQYGAQGMKGAQKIAQVAQQYDLELAVDNVPGHEEFLALQELGYCFFSGILLDKPGCASGGQLSNNRMTLLQLLSALRDDSTNASDIETIVLNDPGLTFKILRMVNSAALSLSREVDSLAHAVNLLGVQQLQRWVSLFLLETAPGQPTELFRASLIRARMCEMLAEMADRDQPLTYFLTGLLSNLDLIAEIPMDELVDQLPLNQEIRDALLDKRGPMGQVIGEVAHYEAGEFEQLTYLIPKAHYEPCYRHCNAWATQIQRSLSH